MRTRIAVVVARCSGGTANAIHLGSQPPRNGAVAVAGTRLVGIKLSQASAKTRQFATTTSTDSLYCLGCGEGRVERRRVHRANPPGSRDA